MPLCVANAQCWKGCCQWCMVIWEEPNGPCHRRNAHDKLEAIAIQSETISVTANQVPGEVVASALSELVPEELGSKLQASDETFCFSLAAVTQEELVEALQRIL